MKINKDCVICLDSLDNNIELKCLPCNHILHLICIEKLENSNCPSNNKCPICRHPFKILNIITPTSNIPVPLPLVQAMLFSFPTLIYPQN